MSEGSSATPDPESTQHAGAPQAPQHARAGHLHHTRAAGAYRGLVAGAIVLALLLVFILENTKDVRISYFGATGHMALGVALLLAAVAGALLVGLVGTVRILQLRRRVTRHRPGSGPRARG